MLLILYCLKRSKCFLVKNMKSTASDYSVLLCLLKKRGNYMLNNFGFSDWVILFLIMVVIMGVVSIRAVEHDKDDDKDINLF